MNFRTIGLLLLTGLSLIATGAGCYFGGIYAIDEITYYFSEEGTVNRFREEAEGRSEQENYEVAGDLYLSLRREFGNTNAGRARDLALEIRVIMEVVSDSETSTTLTDRVRSEIDARSDADNLTAVRDLFEPLQNALDAKDAVSARDIAAEMDLILDDFEGSS